jgi:hypothetical protein
LKIRVFRVKDKEAPKDEEKAANDTAAVNDD